MPHFDRFDIAEAWFCALRDCHGGQWSPEYRRLCRMTMYFKPGLSVREQGRDGLTANGRAIYDRVVERLTKRHSHTSE